MAGPPFVGLTGGIAAGKSEALQALSELGAATLSTDAVVHELLASEEIRDALVARLGPNVAPGGSVDRSAVAELAFGDPKQREWLEGLLWPKVGERVVEWRAKVERMDPPPPAGVVEVPLLFEAGMEQAFDHTLVIAAEESVRAERAGARGHAELEGRTDRQLSQTEKAQRADFVVRNDGGLEELKQGLSRFLETIGRS